MRDRAIELRKTGRSVREIALELGVPRATVGDWVRSVDPLDYVTPEPVPETAEDRRLTLLKARCSSCGACLPWVAFHATAKNPDGTMLRPQSHCKECVKARRRERRRDDPEWAREQNRRDWQRIKSNPDQLARRRELTRENSKVYRLRRSEEAA